MNTGDSTSPAGENLAFGEFYGYFEKRFDTTHCSLGLIAPGDFWMRAQKHTHQAAHFLYVIGGDYLFTARDRERRLPPRSVVYVPAGTTHSNRPATATTRILAISISSEQVGWATEYAPLPQSELDLEGGEIARLAARLEIECAQWSNVSPLVAEGVCLEMLGAVAARAVVAEGAPPRWLRRAQELMRDCCADGLTVERIADEAGVHPVHLCRTFRKFFRCTTGEYLRACRIERATVLLRSSGRSLADIALECGFADQSHFCKTFRRHLGCTPSAFRRRPPGV